MAPPRVTRGGANSEQLISGVIPNDVAWWKNKNAAFEDKLRGNPDIVDLTWANGQLVNQTETATESRE